MNSLKDKMGRYRTRSLFFETSTPEMRSDFEPVFTLKTQNHNNCKSLKQLYLAYEDITEYSFATETFGDWEHWQKLCDLSWFKPYIAGWRAELELKIRSKATKAMLEVALTEGAKGAAAARWVAEAGWKKKAGRPTKEEVEGERKIAAGIDSDITEDLERMGLH